MYALNNCISMVSPSRWEKTGPKKSAKDKEGTEKQGNKTKNKLGNISLCVSTTPEME